MTPSFVTAYDHPVNPLVIGFAVAVGLVLGSFVTTAALRAVNSGSAFRGRSQCDHCKQQLGWSETVPLVSSVWQGGKCRTCQGRIEPLHFWGELTGALILASAFALIDWPQALLVSLVGLTLLALSLIDARTLRLPNALVLMVIALGGIISVVEGTVLTHFLWSAGTFAALKGMQYCLALWLRRPALGSGDVKLVAALALWLGSGIVYALLFASLFALIFIVARRHKGLIAFGPFLAAGAFVVRLVSESPWRLALSLGI